MAAKKCRGTGIAKGNGCGIVLPFSKGSNGLKTYRAKYGLGLQCGCYNEFLINTEQGREVLLKATIQGKKRVEKKKQKQEIVKRKERKEKILTRSDWERRLQREINTIARLIDEGYNCISSGKPINGKYDAGHYYSVGSSPTIRFNLHNIFAQSVNENQFNGGNPIGYINNLKKLFGKEYTTKIIGLRGKYKLLKLTIQELKLHIAAAKRFIKVLKVKKDKRNGERFTMQQRVQLRVEANIYVGIYKE